MPCVNFETLGLQVLLQEIAKLGIVIYAEQPGGLLACSSFFRICVKDGLPMILIVVAGTRQ